LTGWQAETEVGFYTVNLELYIEVTLDGWQYHKIGTFDDIDEAKAAAQADYERRILSALSHHPAPVAANPLRLCGLCHTWNSKPCGDQCGWNPNGQIFEPNRPVAANASAERITEADIRAHVGDGMVSMQNVIDAANEILASRASAEARLREALEFARICIWNGCDTIEALSIIDKALSAHPHASDCDKQGER
jgi:hypothetical protein